ncbi:unnamed protein product [Rotaria sordida]|uniref:Uncharacterized protein n=1 Tax=Rotaria sordida TaxID=392033 RepID=A0A814JBW5_9BILA|nr:unnamed protein product [Rotaria sordida]
MNLLASYFVSCERERNRLRAQKTIEITPNMYRSLGSSSFIPGHLQSIWSKEYAVRSVLFSLTSTQINQQMFSTPSSPRKIRSKSDS